jgi:hypothetical protein
MSLPLQLVVESFHTGYPLLLSNDQYGEYDKYIDLLIDEGKIVKHSEYDFTGEGLADLINNELEIMNSPSRVKVLKTNDSSIETRVKGQGVYFCVTTENKTEKIGILTWTLNALTFFTATV